MFEILKDKEYPLPNLRFTKDEAAHLQVYWYDKWQKNLALEEPLNEKKFNERFFLDVEIELRNSYSNEESKPPYGHYPAPLEWKKTKQTPDTSESLEIAVPKIKTLSSKQQKEFEVEYKKKFSAAQAAKQPNFLTEEEVEKVKQDALNAIGKSDKPAQAPPKPEKSAESGPPPHTVDSTGKFVTLGKDPDPNFGPLTGLKIPIKYFPLSKYSKSKITARYSKLTTPIIKKYPDDFWDRPEFEQAEKKVQKEIDSGKIKLSKAK